MKTTVEVSVDEELVEAAKTRRLDLSRTLEDALTFKLAEQEDWWRSNEQALASYARYLGEQELFGEEYRSF
ncbi:MAG: type II toxin-antitoxin system CcdA family antitoxin [Pseudomonadota bacterium]